MELITYLTFDGTCKEALDFYVETFGAEITMSSPFSDLPPDPNMPPLSEDAADRILHARMTIGGTQIYASDSFPGQPVQHGGFSLSAQFDDVSQAEKAFAALSDGGTVTMAAGKTFWAEYFGVVTDKFGVSWMVNVDLPEG